jgi:hypothetical protein
MSQGIALGMSRVPSIIRLLNPVIRRLLGAGLPFGPRRDSPPEEFVQVAQAHPMFELRSPR